ncbi:MAG: T9SS type A sorting domain-containing protein [Duncaniella sp.]|nr:T9SS type A sorting domain-containing protein [Duncaniella sp.]
MKHFARHSCIAAIAAMSMLPASATITDTGKRVSESLRFLNSQFTFNHETILFTETAEKDYMDGATINLFDKTLSCIKTIPIKYPEISATQIIEQAIHGPIGIYRSNESDESVMENISAESMEQMAEENHYTRKTQSGKVTRYMPDNQAEYYYYDIYGYEYPYRYYEWDAETLSAVVKSVNYDYESYGSTGKYGPAETQTTTMTPTFIPLYPTSESCGDMEKLPVTQTLFNNDAKYEWIISDISALPVSYTNEYERVSGEGLFETGFKIVSEDGSVIETVAYPAGLHCGYNSLDLLIVDDRYYIIAELLNTNYTEEYSIIYELSRTTGMLDMVGEPMLMKVHPTAPVRGTTVDVEIGSTTGNRIVLGLTGSDGRTVISRNLEPGTTRTSIDTSRLTQGVYVVTVTDAAGSLEATKIIVR